MKKFMLILLVGLAVGQYFSNQKAVVAKTEFIEMDSQPVPVNKVNRYQCDGRQYCSQMTSYDEAKYFITYCPDTKMDGDGDGVPCERQFNR
ncbi:excalibur calcium-binding domain-containing protein [Vibrio rumoiensis]|uniref:excalibur calcium-binding domain-containing protein n=1 Tax=Vibrio rumoiensis TaxID=76258 RepID=UPI001E58F4DE|nr:excalibur calcium-binding domain-containing protein [Vibrio rumoiensis]